jgi:hypothetical protein
VAGRPAGAVECQPGSRLTAGPVTDDRSIVVSGLPSANWGGWCAPPTNPALSPVATAAVPEITTAITHLRDVLGDQTYESLARKGEPMTTTAMVAYAYDQIDQARAELNAVS